MPFRLIGKYPALHTRSMRKLLAVILLIASISQAQIFVQPDAGDKVQGPQALYGVWGTPAQCAAHKSGGNENPGLFPYVISENWIQRGMISCYILWRQHSSDAGSTQVHAFAQCGEDSLRDYRLFLKLHDGKLRIRWSEDFTTPELQACR